MEENYSRDSFLIPVVEIQGLDFLDFEWNRFRRDGGLYLEDIFFEPEYGDKISYLLGDHVKLYDQRDRGEDYLDELPDVNVLLSEGKCPYVIVVDGEATGILEEHPKSIDCGDLQFTFVEDLPTRLGELAGEHLAIYGGKDEVVNATNFLTPEEIADKAFYIVDPFERDPWGKSELKAGFNVLFPFSPIHANRYIEGFERGLGARVPERMREEIYRVLRADPPLYEEELEDTQEIEEFLKSVAKKVNTHKKKKGPRI